MAVDDLRASSITGPFKIDTRSKGIHLEEVSGPVQINNRNATVEVSPKTPLGPIDITNVHGEVDLTLPSAAGFQLNAESVGGEIESDFNINVDNAHNNATATGTVGKGGPEVRLRADHGTIQIRKE
jgi:lia operon protein LiaG